MSGTQDAFPPGFVEIVTNFDNLYEQIGGDNWLVLWRLATRMVRAETGPHQGGWYVHAKEKELIQAIVGPKTPKGPSLSRDRVRTALRQLEYDGFIRVCEGPSGGIGGGRVANSVWAAWDPSLPYPPNARPRGTHHSWQISAPTANRTVGNLQAIPVTERPYEYPESEIRTIASPSPSERQYESRTIESRTVASSQPEYESRTVATSEAPPSHPEPEPSTENTNFGPSPDVMNETSSHPPHSSTPLIHEDPANPGLSLPRPPAADDDLAVVSARNQKREQFFAELRDAGWTTPLPPDDPYLGLQLLDLLRALPDTRRLGARYRKAREHPEGLVGAIERAYRELQERTPSIPSAPPRSRETLANLERQIAADDAALVEQGVISADGHNSGGLTGRAAYEQVKRSADLPRARAPRPRFIVRPPE